MTEPEKDEPRGGRLNILIILGVVWMLLSGVCTAVVAVPSLFSQHGVSLGVLALGVGIISFGIGWLIWFSGQGIRNRHDDTTDH